MRPALLISLLLTLSAPPAIAQGEGRRESRKEALRGEALFALALHEGSSALEKVSGELAKGSPAVREAAARALAAFATAEAKDALEQRIPLEEDARVRERLQQSLSRLVP